MTSYIDPVYTVPDPHGPNIKLNSSTTSVALTLTIVLQNLTTSSHKKVVRVNILPPNTRTRCRDQANPLPCQRVLNCVILL